MGLVALKNKITLIEE